MPSGRTHDRITLWCLPIVVGTSVWLTYSLSLTVIICLSYLVGGFMLGPDLDIHSIQYRRWGPFRWIWLPYQKALKHRSRLSHGPIIGTALRVVYLAVWIGLFTIVIVEVLNVVWDAKLTWQSLSVTFNYLLNHYFVEWLAILIGLEIGAISHLVSDAMGSHLVRRRGGRKKGQKKKTIHKKRRS